jgi:cytochrome c oxidase subunit 4
MTHSDHNPGAARDEVLHHPNHFALYMYVFAALVALTACSFFAFSPLWPFHDTPWIGRVFMFTVSCCKAMLVISFFMHLRWEANWKYVLTIPTSIMAIFLMIMLTPDIGFRWLRLSEERKQFDAESAAAHPHDEPHGPAHGGDSHAAAGHDEKKNEPTHGGESTEKKEH